MSIIAFDYDKTYTDYKEEIDLFAEALKINGHKVILVTARNEETAPIMTDVSTFQEIVYTSGKAKASVVRADLFVDDCPVNLCCDFVDGTASAVPSAVLHQGYKDTHNIWNFEEGVFVNYVINPTYVKKESSE
jgi:hypothetical protein